jgi:hypothetical protein
MLSNAAETRISVQLVFYMGDAEFPSAARLLFDPAAVNFL